MRFSKGKWIASNKDTWYVGTTLNRIIYAYIKKLHDGLSKSECHGVPMIYVERQAELEDLSTGDYCNGDVDKADGLRMKDLEELLWVFGTEEPDISDYDFGYPNWLNDTEDGSVDFTCSNDAERDRYHTDCVAYNERKEKGYILFGQIYSTLDW